MHQGYNPGIFLTRVATQGFGANVQETYFKQFLKAYRRAANLICPLASPANHALSPI
jgi:hypothetical protein